MVERPVVWWGEYDRMALLMEVVVIQSFGSAMQTWRRTAVEMWISAESYLSPSGGLVGFEAARVWVAAHHFDPNLGVVLFGPSKGVVVPAVEYILPMNPHQSDDESVLVVDATLLLPILSCLGDLAAPDHQRSLRTPKELDPYGPEDEDALAYVLLCDSRKQARKKVTLWTIGKTDP